MYLVTQAHHYVFARFPPLQFPVLNDLCKLASPHHCIQAAVKSTLVEKTPTFPNPHPPHDLWLMFKTDSWPVTVVQQVISQYYKNTANDFTTPKTFFCVRACRKPAQLTVQWCKRKTLLSVWMQSKVPAHSHNHFLCNETQRSLWVWPCCVRVCVCVLSRGPGGGVSAAQATLHGEAVLDSTQD